MMCEGCGICGNDFPTCSSCNSYFCDEQCLIKNWEIHKKQCKGYLKNAREMKEVIKNGQLRIIILNEMEDRNYCDDGDDCKPCTRITDGIRSFLNAMKLDTNSTKMSFINSESGEWRKCRYNVRDIIQKYGGKSVLGWNLYEGDKMVEAEAHCVWVPNNKTCFLNVTKNSEGNTYSCLFMPDPNVALYILKYKKLPPNYVFWK